MSESRHFYRDPSLSPLERSYDALLAIEELLATEVSDLSEQGRRRYLAYLLSIDAREPQPHRADEIVGLRERFGV